jgi:hypothetical protein
LLGETFAFSATVSNSTDNTVSWSVNGIHGGSAQAGTISADGVYTAPPDVPQGGTVQVTATSHADSTKFAAATVTISSDIAVSLSPGISKVELGATQSFHASVASNGHPNPAIRWSLSGPACPTSCGSIDSSGNYTAPQNLPNNANLTVLASSAADPTKQSTASVTITSSFALQLAAPSNLQPGATAAVLATLTPVPGSKPNSLLGWSIAGSGCSGGACGLLTVTTTQAAGTNSFADTANYTAPEVVPQPNTVIITVTPEADPTRKTQATIAIQEGASLVLTPGTATLAATHRITLTAHFNGQSSDSLQWAVNGIAGGNANLGRICIVGSNPCQSFTSGTASQIDFLAPGAIPGTNPVSVTATSVSDPSLSAASQITVINHILVSVMPNSITIPPMGIQVFGAAVLGSSNPAVLWQVQGSGCTSAGLCGSVTGDGTYTAPVVPPTPNTLQVVAIGQDDSTQSGVANVTISTGANILSLHPASVYAGAADGFTLRVDGSGFVPSNPGPGSALQIGGTLRFTTCDSAISCTAPVSSADVAQAGSLNIQIQNPNHSTSNIVHLIVVAPGAGEDVITLTNAIPGATGKEIAVVEPTTAGLSTDQSDLNLDVAAIGLYVTASNTCNLAGNPIPLIRPVSGSTAADICVFSQAGFDTGMNYSFSGPGDIAVIARQPAGLGMIHLTLQIPAGASPGSRTLFIQSAQISIARPHREFWTFGDAWEASDELRATPALSFSATPDRDRPGRDCRACHHPGATALSAACTVFVGHRACPLPPLGCTRGKWRNLDGYEF